MKDENDINYAAELKHRESVAVQMEYSMQDWDEMYCLENDTVFIREISELVVGDAFDRFTRAELLQHLGNLLNEREELIEAYVRSKTMLDITVGNIVDDFNNNFKSEESITEEEE